MVATDLPDMMVDPKKTPAGTAVVAINHVTRRQVHGVLCGVNADLTIVIISDPFQVVHRLPVADNGVYSVD